MPTTRLPAPLHCFAIVHATDEAPADCMAGVPCYSADEACYWLREAFDDWAGLPEGSASLTPADDAAIRAIVAEAMRADHRREWPRRAPTTYSAYGVTVGVALGALLL